METPTKCYHCGASGVPLVEWQLDPPRPDIPGPFPMVCANGCGRGEWTATALGVLRIENIGDTTVTLEREPRTWDLDTEDARHFTSDAQIGDRVKWKQSPSAPEPSEPAPLDPLLLEAIAAGIITEGQARDLDALADGVVARQRSGEISGEQASEIASSAAVRDGLAELRARAARRGR